MVQGQQHIHCSVANCSYWQQGNKCNAGEIMVTTDRVGASQPDSWDAPMASSAAPTPAGTCMETCCKTFADKSKKQDWSVDGVTKLT